MVTLKAIFFLVSAANWPKTVSRKFVRGRVVIRNYLGLWRTDFDERPSGHVSIHGGSDGLSERSCKIRSRKIWRDQGPHSCMYIASCNIMEVDILHKFVLVVRY